MRVAIVVVAAGLSRRFGSSKMVYEMPDRRFLIEHSLDAYFSDLVSTHQSPVAVVIPHNSSALKRAVQTKKAIAVECKDSQAGMSASIKAGLCAVLSVNSDIDACLIGLGDMPYIAPQTIAQLMSLAQPDQILVPCKRTTQGTLKNGNPVVFGKEFFAEVLALHGDTGGKGVVKAHPQAVTRVEVQDDGIFQDIDRPGDLRI